MSAVRNRIFLVVVLLTSYVSGAKFVGIAQSTSSVLVANCGTGSSAIIANITRVVAGSSGTVMFSCGANGPAITVARSGTVTPQFSLPPGYISLEISTSPVCASAITLSPGLSLTFGTGHGTFPVAGYNYCASFSAAPATGLQTFTVTWTQSAPSISSVACGHDLSCSVQSNSTLSAIRFAGNTIHVEADGPHGARGYANVTVPKSSIPHIDELHVFVDNNKLTSSAVTITSNSTDYFIYFTFTFHSPVLIDIQLVAPEPTPNAPTILGLDPTLFYEIIGTVVAGIVIVSAAFVIRRRGRTRPTI